MTPLKKKLSFVALSRVAMAAVAVLGLANCASTGTVESRMAKHAEAFSTLTPDQQQMVRQGRIEEGMPKQGVFLAWGSPSKRMEGSKAGKAYETWVYREYEPQVTHQLGFGYGTGWGGYGLGRRGRYGYGCGSGYDFSFGPTVHYVPRTSAVVNFENEQVSSWETEG